MNKKKAKALRRALRGANLPPSKLMQHVRTRQVRLGHGFRAVYQKAKKLSEEKRSALIDALSVLVKKEATA